MPLSIVCIPQWQSRSDAGGYELRRAMRLHPQRTGQAVWGHAVYYSSPYPLMKSDSGYRAARPEWIRAPGAGDAVPENWPPIWPLRVMIDVDRWSLFGPQSR